MTSPSGSHLPGLFEEKRGAAMRAFRLPRADRRPIYEWAHKHLILHEGYSPPGPFNVEISPWLKEIFHALQCPLTRLVHLRKAIQDVGGTLVADIWIPWLLCNDPGNISATMQTDEMAEKYAKSRLMPLLESNSCTAALLPRPGPKRTTTEIFFGGYFLMINPANISAQQSQSIRYKFNDELWHPRWQEVYADAIGRVRAYERAGRSKIYNASQGGIEGDVEDQAYRSGTQEEWSALCPKCSRSHPLSFAQMMKDDPTTRAGVVWDREAKRDDNTFDLERVVASVRFRCPACGHESGDSDSTRSHWKKTGHYVAQVKEAGVKKRSFHVESIVNRSLALVAEEFCTAENEFTRYGNDEPRRKFRQKTQALPWRHELNVIRVSTQQSGYVQADYADGSLIPNESARYMTIDKQETHYWVEIGACTPEPEYRQLYFGRVETVESIRELQARYKVPDWCIAQDRGYKPSEVDQDCVRFGWRGMMGSRVRRRTWPMQDEQTKRMVNHPHSPPLSAAVGGGAAAIYYEFNGDYFKDVLFNCLGGRGFRWMVPDDVNPLWPEHISGEHKVEVRSGVYEWKEVKSNAPNHGLDTSVMMLCVMTITGIVRFIPPEDEK